MWVVVELVLYVLEWYEYHGRTVAGAGAAWLADEI